MARTKATLGAGARLADYLTAVGVRVINRQLGFLKVPYRGLKKNDAQLVACRLASLKTVRFARDMDMELGIALREAGYASRMRDG